MREQVRLVTPLGAGSVLYKANDFGKRGGGQPAGRRCRWPSTPPRLPGAAGEHRAELAVGRDLSRHGQARADAIRPRACGCGSARRCWFRGDLPAWLLLTYFAEPLIRLLFTDAYVAATPYFQVFLLLMLRQCFQFSTPLRSVEDNASFAHARTPSRWRINVALIVALMPRFGLWGPTLGLVVGQIWTVYLPRSRASWCATSCRCREILPLAQARAGRCSRRRWWRSPRCTAR